MKKVILFFLSMIVANTFIGQEIRTLLHPRADLLQKASGQNLMIPDNSGNMFTKPEDIGNPPDVNWIKQFGGDGSDIGQDVITDAWGNLYVTGYFSGPVSFGATTLTSVGYTDCFLAKFTGAGNLIWLRQLSCNPYEIVRGFGITLDHSGNVYITGSFNGITLHVGNNTLYKTGPEDAFIAKYDSAGIPVMATHYGNSSLAKQGKSIAVDADGSCYVIIGDENANANGGNSFTKFSHDGYFQWEYINGAYFTDIKYNNYSRNALSRSMPACVSIDPPDATAYDSLTITFDPALACFQNGSLAGSSQVFMHSGVTVGGNVWQYVVDYNALGHNGQTTELTPNGDGTYSIHLRPSAFYGLPAGLNVTQLCIVFNDGQWGSKDGRDFVPNSVNCMDIFVPLNHAASDPALYLTGYIRYNVDFGNTTLTATPSRNAPFLARFPATEIYSDFEWAIQGSSIGTSGSAYNRASALVVDDNENIYFSGRFRRLMAFGEDTLTGYFSYVPYLVKCTHEGIFEWARQGMEQSPAVNNTYVYPVEVTRDPSGNPLISFELLNDSIAFGSFILGGTGGGMVKYDLNGNVQWATGKENSPKGIDGTANDRMTYTGFSSNGNILLVQDNASGAQQWNVETAGNSGSAQVAGLVTDSQGNLFVCGNTNVATSLFGNTTGTFLARLKADGDTLWTISLNGGNFTAGYGNFLSMDREDNICVIGSFSDTLGIGSDTLINNGANKAIFIAKINGSGNLLWLKKIGDGQNYVFGNSVATDNSSNVIVSGIFTASLTIGTHTLIDAGWDDTFIAKFDGNGNVIWAQRAGGDNTEYCGFASIDGSNNIYLTGEFLSRTITIGSEAVHLNNNDGDVALIKFNSAGQLIWFKAYGGGEVDSTERYSCWPNAITTDVNGNSYIYGWTGRSNRYGPFLLESPYYYNFSLIKTNTSGNVQWARIIKERAYGWQSSQIDIDEGGNCYIGGNFRDTIYFENNMVVNQGRSDMFFAKYGNSGNFVGAKIFSSNPLGRTGIPNASNNLYGISVYDSASQFFGGNSSYDMQFDDVILHSSNSNGFISLIGEDIHVGMNEVRESLSGFTLYPNPADHDIYLFIREKEYLNTKEISVEILNLSGQVISRVECTSNHGIPLCVDVHALTAGIYFVKVKTGQQVITEKFIKK
ncbi:MAG: SBBP repeat-containing protein [Bacteroidota bacterium]